VEFLIDQHVVDAEDPAPLSGLDALLGDYRRWLIEERGLAEATVLRYHNCARRFLAARTGVDGVVDVGSLTGVQVSAFLLAEAQRCSVGALRGVAELRALLRYLYLRGSTPTLLSGSIPPVAEKRRPDPTGTVARRCRALLDSCDRSTAADYVTMRC
jgi:hypothetical protein